MSLWSLQEPEEAKRDLVPSNIRRAEAAKGRASPAPFSHRVTEASLSSRLGPKNQQPPLKKELEFLKNLT